MDILEVTNQLQSKTLTQRIGLIKMNQYYLVSKSLIRTALICVQANKQNACINYSCEPYGQVEIESFNKNMFILMKDDKLLIRNFSLEASHFTGQRLDC